DFDDFWRESVFRGVVSGTAEAPVNVSAVGVSEPLPPTSDVELALYLDQGVMDGRFANNGWLQELPRPISKITWDNAALVSPSMAEDLGVVKGAVVTPRVGSRSVDAPAFVQAGPAAGSIGLALGSGRTTAGAGGNGVGVNASAVRTSSERWAAPLQVSRTGGRYKVVT